MNSVLDIAPSIPSDVAKKARSHGSFRRPLAAAGVVVYVLGLLTAMLWSFFIGGDWKVGLLTLPHAFLAALFAGGAMGMALLFPDPYVAENGEPPAKLPDFD